MAGRATLIAVLLVAAWAAGLIPEVIPPDKLAEVRITLLSAAFFAVLGSGSRASKPTG